jgi:hypothetical protein
MRRRDVVLTLTPHRLSESALRRSGGSCSDDTPDLGPRPRRRERDEPGYERWLAARPSGSTHHALPRHRVDVDRRPPAGGPTALRAVGARLRRRAVVLWGIFVDFLAKLVAAPSTHRASGVARTLLRSRTNFLAAATAVATFAVAQLAWLAERDRDTFVTFGDALLWAAGPVVGTQGDPLPEAARAGCSSSAPSRSGWWSSPRWRARSAPSCSRTRGTRRRPAH